MVPAYSCLSNLIYIYITSLIYPPEYLSIPTQMSEPLTSHTFKNEILAAPQAYFCFSFPILILLITKNL